MIKVSAPGKLCISGEWAVLEVGNPLIVAAVDKRVFAKIKESKDKFIHISIKDFGIENLKALFKGNELSFEKRLKKGEEKYLFFIKSAIESVLKYFNRVKPFEIETWGEDIIIKTAEQIKTIGFGASAASVVATVASLFKFYGKDIKKEPVKEKIYKLSTIAHYFAQGKVGSGFDTAASTFGGVFIYKRFNPDWLMNQFKKGKHLREIIKIKWPGFYIKSLKIPNDFNLLVGWTGEFSSTAKMIKQLNNWKKNNKGEHKRIIGQIKSLVEQLIEAWGKSDKEKLLQLIKKNEDYLRELGDKSGLNIETEKLWKLSKIANNNGGAGKLSGAGGGDCGIAITFNEVHSEKIKKEWQKNGIYFINTILSQNGVREEN